MGFRRRFGVLLVLVVAFAGCEKAPPSPSEYASRAPTPRAAPPTVEPAIDPAPPPATPRRTGKPKAAKPTKRRVATAAAARDDRTTDTVDALDAFAAPEHRDCCRYCGKGKACGNSCIAATKTCHQGVGCACDL
ncbi:MAG TPA: hypothetical protein VIV40_15605 [Kofleriaceae bacterium]